ncbi:hypothetical protein EVAR_32490_1 [Eumeta japonica]|uniref:Uncharacterized protein n=1 Tax=Eumeta variegata TaxID=151549 RepID=A0A4C1W7C1_EUMVA|nr:hypothetical protein EVAR_32490_1 [Eumeta japonica]
MVRCLISCLRVANPAIVDAARGPSGAAPARALPEIDVAHLRLFLITTTSDRNAGHLRPPSATTYIFCDARPSLAADARLRWITHTTGNRLNVRNTPAGTRIAATIIRVGIKHTLKFKKTRLGLFASRGAGGEARGTNADQSGAADAD